MICNGSSSFTAAYVASSSLRNRWSINSPSSSIQSSMTLTTHSVYPRKCASAISKDSSLHLIATERRPSQRSFAFPIWWSSFCCLLKDERPDANLDIKLMFGMNIPSHPSHRTHEQKICDIPLTFTCSIRRCLARDEVVVCIDLGHIEPFLINLYIVVHIVELLSSWIHKGLWKI